MASAPFSSNMSNFLLSIIQLGRCHRPHLLRSTACTLRRQFAGKAQNFPHSVWYWAYDQWHHYIQSELVLSSAGYKWSVDNQKSLAYSQYFTIFTNVYIFTQFIAQESDGFKIYLHIFIRKKQNLRILCDLILCSFEEKRGSWSSQSKTSLLSSIIFRNSFLSI